MAKLRKTSLRSLRPTQLTVGMIVVHDKKKHLCALKEAQRQDFLQAHPMPAVVGPKPVGASAGCQRRAALLCRDPGFNAK